MLVFLKARSLRSLTLISIIMSSSSSLAPKISASSTNNGSKNFAMEIPTPPVSNALLQQENNCLHRERSFVLRIYFLYF